MVAELDHETVQEAADFAETERAHSQGVELCGNCGHLLAGHLYRKCPNTNGGQPCKCVQGIRTDVVIAIHLRELRKSLDAGIGYLGNILLAAHKLKVTEEGIVSDTGLVGLDGKRV